MIVFNICKLLYSLIQSFLGIIFVQIYQFTFQGVEISLHWCIIIRISGLTHTLGYMNRFAKLYECFRSELRPLIRV